MGMRKKCCFCCSTSSDDEHLPSTPPTISELSVEELDQLFIQVERLTLQGNASDQKKIHMSENVQKSASQLDNWISKYFTEVTIGAQISRDVLNALGNMHWICAGLTIVAMGLNMTLKMYENKEECADIMSDALEIWKRVMKPLLDRRDGTPNDFMQESISLIIEAYLYCKSLFNSRKLKRFTLVHSHGEELQMWKKKLELFWPKAIAVLSIDMGETLSVPLPQASMTPATRIVGLEERKRDVMKILNLDNKEVTRVVVLHGIGGVGKSTLGDAVYSQVSLSGGRRCRCRIELGEKPSRERITNLQKQMVENLTGQSLLMERDSEIIRDKLRKVLMDENRDPVFIYIDNVLQQRDLEDFLPLDCEQIALPKGSRWLVTTRDESVCTTVFERNRGLDVKQFDVRIMNEKDARKLFFWHAFGHEEPSKEVVEEYDDSGGFITEMVTSICGNLPLALRVLGRSLYNMSPPMWRKTYSDIKSRGMPGSLEKQVSNVLKSSYDTLDDETQTAFLLICVCFVGEYYYRVALDVVESILSRASTYRLFELGLLELQHASPYFAAIKMHDLVRTLGYEMAVARKCAPPKMPTRKQDLLDCDESSWSAIKWLRVPAFQDGIEAEFLEQCRELEVLLLKTHVNGDIKNVPQHLKVVVTNSSCPLELIEKLKKLVYLEVEEMQEFPVVASTRSLQVLRGGSIHNKEAIDRHKTTLRKLSCRNIVELSPYFCHQMSKLQTLTITGFKGSNLPDEIGDLATLESLWIESECLVNLPRSLQKLTQLQGLMLELKDVEEIPSGVLRALKRLEYIHLKIDRVTSVPMQEISQLVSLEALVLRIPHVERLATQPDHQLQPVLSLKLDKLKFFILESDNMCSLEGVQLMCPSLQFLRLHLKQIQVLPQEFIATELPKLQTLILWQCDCLKELPSEIKNLPSLENLVMRDCMSVKTIPKGLMKSLEGLVIFNCPTFMELPHDLDEDKSRSMKFLCCNEACIPPAISSLPNVVALPEKVDEHVIQRVDFFVQGVDPITVVSRYRCFF